MQIVIVSMNQYVSIHQKSVTMVKTMMTTAKQIVSTPIAKTNPDQAAWSVNQAVKPIVPMAKTMMSMVWQTATIAIVAHTAPVLQVDDQVAVAAPAKYVTMTLMMTETAQPIVTTQIVADSQSAKTFVVME